MTKDKWINICKFVIIYYATNIVVKINARSIIYGKTFMDLDGSLKIPVFIPISWLIHDIHSAKLIGHKSDSKDMMTSDMTPDSNGNFDSQTSDQNKEKSGTSRVITSRVSNTKTISESPENQTLSTKQSIPEERPQLQIRDPLLDSAEMRLRLETTQQKVIAKQRFTDELMYEPDVWPKEVDPLFTTIEIYEVPGVSKYMGLASNRTAVHKSPDEELNIKAPDKKIKIRVKASKVNVENVKVSDSSKQSNYFRNYLDKVKKQTS